MQVFWRHVPNFEMDRFLLSLIGDWKEDSTMGSPASAILEMNEPPQSQFQGHNQRSDVKVFSQNCLH